MANCPSGPHPLYELLFPGLFMICLGLLYACIGKAYARFHGWVYRAKDPKEFWLEVAGYCLFGLILICLSFYER
jgi:hypothetical protein